jgi:hypothetical protein
MANDDNALTSAMWLVAGGAAGYAAGRWLVAPWFATRASALPRASSSGALVPQPVAAARPTRALVAGPPGSAMPIDPYGPAVVGASASPYAGPSGEMRPIDPYADVPSVASVATGMPFAPAAPGAPNVVTPPVVVAPSAPSAPTPTPVLDGPITTPSQVATPSGPITSPSHVLVPTGPIASPSQLVEVSPRPATELPASPPRPASTSSPNRAPTRAPSRAFATKPRVRRFDRVFETYRGHLPIEYVRALAERESDGNPAARTGSAIGLMQIVPVVLADYNKRHGTAYTREHLLDSAINVAIGCELLHLIVASYRKHHPRIANMREDWNNPRFVELLTFGWNAGYSEAGGVGRVARYLEGLGAVDIDLEQVSAHARLAGASKHLSNLAKVAWSKGVVALYQRERALVSARVFATS